MTEEKRKKVALWTTNVLSAFVFVSGIFFAIKSEWAELTYSVALFLLLLAPNFLRKRYRFYLPITLEAATTAFLILTLFFGSINNFYEMYGWWDGVLHFSSGLLLTSWGFVIYHHPHKDFKLITEKPLFISLFAVCLSISLSAIWEMYEFLYDIVLKSHMTESGLPDTIGDMTTNLVGSIIIGILAYQWMRTRKKIPFSPLILSSAQLDHTKM